MLKLCILQNTVGTEEKTDAINQIGICQVVKDETGKGTLVDTVATSSGMDRVGILKPYLSVCRTIKQLIII